MAAGDTVAVNVAAPVVNLSGAEGSALAAGLSRGVVNVAAPMG